MAKFFLAYWLPYLRCSTARSKSNSVRNLGPKHIFSLLFFCFSFLLFYFGGVRKAVKNITLQNSHNYQQILTPASSIFVKRLFK